MSGLSDPKRSIASAYGELGLAEPAQDLVAEAARDLEVALETADHQQLLEQLRRLRQRVPVTCLQAGRHEEVARALRGGTSEHGRLDFEEVLLVEHVADRLDDLVAQLQRVLHRCAAKVHGSVLEPDRLVDLKLVFVDRERRRLSFSEHGHLAHAQLDLARANVRVDVLRLALCDLAGHGDDVLGAQPLGGCEDFGRAAVRMEHELQHTGAVAQVDEDEAAVVTPAVYPSRNAQRAASVALAHPACPAVAEFVCCRFDLHER